MSLHYLNELFIKASEPSSSLRSSYQKLQQPFQKVCTGRNAFYQVSEEIKGTTNLILRNVTPKKLIRHFFKEKLSLLV